MDSKRPQLMLRVPTPDQRSLTFCDATPAGLKRWLEQLPRMEYTRDSPNPDLHLKQ